MALQSSAEYQVTTAMPSKKIRHYALISMIILLLSLSAFYHQNTLFSEQETGSQIWLQPGSLITSMNIDHALIAPNDWDFDFESIEVLALDIKFDEMGSLRINAELADLLNQLVNQLPMTLDVPNIQRVAILLEKMYPGSGGQTLAQIFYNFYLYRQAYQQSVADFSGEPNLNEVLFRHEAELQKQYLGEVLVRQLFAEQNLLANYLFGRKLINQNKVLSRLEKQQKLSELKDEFVRQKR